MLQERFAEAEAYLMIFSFKVIFTDKSFERKIDLKSDSTLF